MSKAVAPSGALVIHPDGEIVDVDLQPGADHLALMSEHLRCNSVDCVALTDRIDMWIDDEGLYTKPVNPAATALAGRYGFTWQNYHGPVLLCGGRQPRRQHQPHPRPTHRATHPTHGRRRRPVATRRRPRVMPPRRPPPNEHQEVP